MLSLRSPAKKILVVGLLLAISGCARHYADVSYLDPYGFFSGIWHGILFPLTLCVNVMSWLISLIGINFLQDIEIIGRPNTGFFYYVGFVLGLVALDRA